MATTVALKLRDESFEPALKLQVLIYPFLQAVDLQLPSYIRYESGPWLTRSMKAFFLANYLYGSDERLAEFLNNDHVSSDAKKKLASSHMDLTTLPSKFIDGFEKSNVETSEGNFSMWNELKAKLLSPYLSPLLAETLHSLPLTYLITAEHDALRDEGFLYVRRLRQSGVEVEHRHSDIAMHGSMTMFISLPEIDDIFCAMTSFISDHL